MNNFIAPLENLIDRFRSLPGVGYKTAVRMAFSVIDMNKEDALAFSKAISDAKDLICRCKICQDISDTEICRVCSSGDRNKSVICVVETSKDVVAIERVRDYNGLFHVLGGLISPIDGIGPEKLKIKELLSRINDEVKEVIIATNPSIEGEATAMYLGKLLKPFGIKITRLAYGLPAGGELEYADDMTLCRALDGRREIDS